jgi:hypothetical protein
VLPVHPYATSALLELTEPPLASAPNVRTNISLRKLTNPAPLVPPTVTLALTMAMELANAKPAKLAMSHLLMLLTRPRMEAHAFHVHLTVQLALEQRMVLLLHALPAKLTKVST